VLGRSSDGYELAQALDNLGYSPDAELVEILDEIGFVRLNICSRLEEQRVKVSGLTGPAVGSKVQFKNVDDRKDYEGEVTENKAASKSIVFCPSLGHAREGMGTRGLYINWENLQKTAHA
jgi:hypothetical protein